MARRGRSQKWSGTKQILIAEAILWSLSFRIRRDFQVSDEFFCSIQQRPPPAFLSSKVALKWPLELRQCWENAISGQG